MFNIFRWLALWLIVTGLLACYLLPGDASFKVEGVVIPPDHRNDIEYDLELYLDENKELCDSKKISNRFFTSFIIAPRKMKYFLVISTIDREYTYRTNPLVLGDPKLSHEPVDLGDIELIRE